MPTDECQYTFDKLLTSGIIPTMKQYLPFLITAIIIAGIIGFSIMAKTSMEINAEARARQEALNLRVNKQKGLEACLREVQETYLTNWNTQCDRIGRGYDCLLPNQNADNIHQARVSGSINCQKLWE